MINEIENCLAYCKSQERKTRKSCKSDESTTSTNETVVPDIRNDVCYNAGATPGVGNFPALIDKVIILVQSKK